MAINFNIKAVLENTAGKEKEIYKPSIEDTLAANDLVKCLDNICPVSGEVSCALKTVTSDPKNLRIVQDVEKVNEYYIEANEFINFCEANDASLYQGLKIIVEAYENDGINMDIEKIHIVMPSKTILKEACCKSKDGLGYNKEVKWSSDLIKACNHCGISVKVDIDEDDEVVEVEEN